LFVVNTGWFSKNRMLRAKILLILCESVSAIISTQIRQIKADPPETTTQSATEHMSALKDRTQNFRGATPNTLTLLV